MSDRTIALIHVAVQNTEGMGGNREHTRVFKVETPRTPGEPEQPDAIALWEHTTGGYGYLEDLGTDDPDEALDRAENRVEDYVPDDNIVGTEVIER